MSCVLQACPSDDDGSGDNGALGEDACPARIRDTLGFEYGYDCDEVELSIVAESPEPPMCSDPEVAVFRLRPATGMPLVCYFQGEPGSSSGTTSADSCRPLACAERSDCPGGFPCVGGICRVRPMTITDDNVYALCLADIPWPGQCSFDAFHPDFVDRIEPLMEACPDDSESCMLPPECPQ